jgi:antitoxin MazE
MKTNIIRIGNSQGIRIPKVLLEQSRLEKDVELEVTNKKIIIRAASQPRQGWEEKFKHMAQHKDDKPVDKTAPTQTRWEKEEWEW